MGGFILFLFFGLGQGIYEKIISMVTTAVVDTLNPPAPRLRLRWQKTTTRAYSFWVLLEALAREGGEGGYGI